jgi:hypothetical protein
MIISFEDISLQIVTCFRCVSSPDNPLPSAGKDVVLRLKFAALCQKRFFHDVECHYDNILKKQNLQTLHIGRRHFDALFLVNVFSGTKQCPSVLETVGIRVPTRNMRNFTMFTCSFSKMCVRCKCSL